MRGAQWHARSFGGLGLALALGTWPPRPGNGRAGPGRARAHRLEHRRTALALLFLGRACMLPARMKLRPRLFVVLSVLLWAASFPGSVAAHGTVGAGGMGWSDELALALTPLILVLALGWFVLDGRRASKPHPHRRRRARR
jgi:hypothetical protein